MRFHALVTAVVAAWAVGCEGTSLVWCFVRLLRWPWSEVFRADCCIYLEI
jgi:hypothetical protein